MFKVIESNGQRFELTCNAATALTYKQVFKKEISQELEAVDIASLQGFNDLSPEEKIQKVMEKQSQMQNLIDLWIRLGFIMTIQNKPFEEYWNRTSYDDYAAWRATMDTSVLQDKEFIAAVAGLWTEDQKGSSSPKN